MNSLKHQFGDLCTQVISLKRFLRRTHKRSFEPGLTLLNQYKLLEANDENYDDDNWSFFEYHCKSINDSGNQDELVDYMVTFP